MMAHGVFENGARGAVLSVGKEDRGFLGVSIDRINLRLKMKLRRAFAEHEVAQAGLRGLEVFGWLTRHADVFYRLAAVERTCCSPRLGRRLGNDYFRFFEE